VSHYRNKKLLQAARGQACTACGAAGREDVVVACHANSVALGKGTGIKVPDYYVAYLCAFCHDLYDGRAGKLTKEERDEIWMRAYLKTVASWFTRGIVVVP